MNGTLLELDGVSKYYQVRGKRVSALENVSLRMPGDTPQIVALAGESGSGKSTLANLVLGFETADAGSVMFNGESVAAKRGAELHQYRADVQAVFQDPFGVFNPFYRVRHVFDLIFRNYRAQFAKRDRAAQVEKSLNSVGLQGGDVLDKYPHQLSGGQRQRIMMARACLMQPKLIVADEPVSMVDASLRAAILEVMMKLRDEQGIAFLYITHDLATAYQVCDEILVLYQGSVMEQGSPVDVIGSPKHPYAKLLVDSIPGIEYEHDWVHAPVQQITEENADSTAQACRFAGRCQLADSRCKQAVPELIKFHSESKADSQRYVACHYHDRL